jgi:hypothetical protein
LDRGGSLSEIVRLHIRNTSWVVEGRGRIDWEASRRVCREEPEEGENSRGDRVMPGLNNRVARRILTWSKAMKVRVKAWRWQLAAGRALKSTLGWQRRVMSSNGCVRGKTLEEEIPYVAVR